MGLDMYLHAKRFLSDYNEEDKALIDVIRAERVKGLDLLDLRYLQAEAMYWRKANHIHKWFVTNVQDGTDDCGDYHVSREQLQALHDLCEAVLLDRSRAEELLPCGEGFFFGSTDYDEGYFGDIEFTKTRLDKLLNNEDLQQWDFYYHSSW